MNNLWMSINTTCLEPPVANVVEMAVVLQVDGKVVNKSHWNIAPIKHQEDALFRKRSPEDFLKAYHGWLKTTDPMYQLQEHKSTTGESFFYNASTLEYLNLEPSALLQFSSPRTVLNELKVLLGGERWTVIAHNVAFHLDCLLGWSKRAGDTSLRAENIIAYDKGIDTVPFFRAVAAFRPDVARRGFRLKEVGRHFGLTVGNDCKSKVEALMTICESVIEGKLNATKQDIPSENSL